VEFKRQDGKQPCLFQDPETKRLKLGFYDPVENRMDAEDTIFLEENPGDLKVDFMEARKKTCSDV